MAAKIRSPKPSEPTSWAKRSTLLLLLLVLVCALLGGIIWAGHLALEYLHGRPRYDVPFVDIECDAPVGMRRQSFLDEVRFESRLPAYLHLLDDDLTKKLQEGFARHPWVENVQEVQITPPRNVAVKLTFRTPVLAVKVGKTTRTVDRFGILLRPDSPTLGLPTYMGEARPPAGAAGSAWGDPNVEAAARKLGKKE